MARVICIDGARYVLPMGISPKDVQAVAGFLVTLTRVNYEYIWGDGEQQYYADRGAEVRIEELELVTKAEAKEASDKSRAEYEAKKAAQAAAE